MVNNKSDIGKKHNKLLVLKEEIRKNETYCYCKCDCGNEKWICKASVKQNISCGCGGGKYKQNRKNPIYSTWSNQKDRCYNKNCYNWKDYGGRGITMFEPWKNNFLDWLKYVESLPYYGCSDRTLDRIDNNKGYEPGNLRWATKKEQANNKRNIPKITFDSKTHSVAEWSVIIGISPGTIHQRLKLGWSIEKTLTTELRKKVICS